MNVEEGSFGSFKIERFDFALQSIGGIGFYLQVGGERRVRALTGADVEDSVFVFSDGLACVTNLDPSRIEEDVGSGFQGHGLIDSVFFGGGLEGGEEPFVFLINGVNEEATDGRFNGIAGGYF